MSRVKSLETKLQTMPRLNGMHVNGRRTDPACPAHHGDRFEWIASTALHVLGPGGRVQMIGIVTAFAVVLILAWRARGRSPAR